MMGILGSFARRSQGVSRCGLALVSENACGMRSVRTARNQRQVHQAAFDEVRTVLLLTSELLKRVYDRRPAYEGLQGSKSFAPYPTICRIGPW